MASISADEEFIKAVYEFLTKVEAGQVVHEWQRAMGCSVRFVEQYPQFDSDEGEDYDVNVVLQGFVKSGLAIKKGNSSSSRYRLSDSGMLIAKNFVEQGLIHSN